MIWEKIRGHEVQTAMFRRAAGRGRLSHAYLFLGPEGVGKKRFAEALAQCLLCERFSEPELEACGECPSCRQMLAGTHPDFHPVGLPAGKSAVPLELFVGDDEHRGREGLCYELSLRPSSGRRRVAIIDDGDRLSQESANALLKTLEEPPAYSLLILIAPSGDGLLPTIRSRCQHVRFSPLPAQDTAELIVELGWTDDSDEAQTVAALSAGSLAVAQQLLHPELRALRDGLYDALSSDRFDSVGLADRMRAGLDELGGETPTQRRNADWLIHFTMEFYRTALRALSEGNSDTALPQVQRFVSRFDANSPDDLERIADLLERAELARRQLERHTPVALCLEGLFDDLGRIARGMRSG